MCHEGPGPGFLAPWIYKYVACGLQEVLKDLPQALSTGSLYRDIYKKVSHAINLFSINVPLTDKPGSWFLLAKCLKNTCGKITLSQVFFKYFANKNELLVST